MLLPLSSLLNISKSVKLGATIISWLLLLTAGNLWGGDDAAVFAALAATAKRLNGAGHEIVMMSAFPEDDRWIIELMRSAGIPEAVYVPGYADLEDTMQWLGSAELVIGERLHASILAAACATPFVALEYRPKIRDFAKSIEAEDLVVRTDDLQELDATVSRALQDGDRVRSRLQKAVAHVRAHQRDVAERLSNEMTTLLR